MVTSTANACGAWLPTLATVSIASLCTIAWWQRVEAIVPSPYLDEVFHVRQAQAYWQGRWHDWDPKITTPPGLYVLSWTALKLGQLIAWPVVAIDGSTANFRATNALVVFGLLQWRLRKLLQRLEGKSQGLSWRENWTALNVCLFPPLFFFVGLYYTDLASLLLVLEAYLSDTTDKVRLQDWSDYVKVTTSIAINGLLHAQEVLRAVLPHLLVFAAFGAFVGLNGSIVLGHQEFHSAQIHLAQMLYIWPYLVFFSWPVIAIPMLLWALRTVKAQRPGALVGVLPSPLVACGAMLLMTAVVAFNTIVHPFTLADNRHYVFYVFRVLLRQRWRRFAAVPVYLVCAWASLTTFSGAWAGGSQEMAEKRGATGASEKPTSFKGMSCPTSRLTTAYAFRRDGGKIVSVSLVLVWLAATALTVVTAPLVEPRYFIVPWVLWRIHLATPALPSGSCNSDAKWTRWAPLLLETLWYAAINLGVGYMFLYRGFEWPQEPGVTQRFMW
ncbi:glucosyltransferase [Ascosphaera acerosa]|nr:glucosyltransferase [Ascosphaera acerosa]